MVMAGNRSICRLMAGSFCAANWWIVLTLFVSLWVWWPVARAQTDLQQLATRYFEARRSVVVFSDAAHRKWDRAAMDAEITGLAGPMLSAIQQEVPGEWTDERTRRLRSVIESGLRAFFTRVQDDPRGKAAMEQSRAVFEREMVSQLGRARLVALLDWYESPAGARFGAVQARMLERLRVDLVDVAPRASPSDAVARTWGELLPVFFDLIAVLRGAVDPGPGADRSGVAAMTYTVAAAARVSIDFHHGAWMSLSQSDRESVMAWRKTAVALEELEALERATAAAAVSARSFMGQAAGEALLQELAMLHGQWIKSARSLVQAEQ